MTTSLLEHGYALPVQEKDDVNINAYKIPFQMTPFLYCT
jgi:hypothetical protein